MLSVCKERNREDRANKRFGFFTKNKRNNVFCFFVAAQVFLGIIFLCLNTSFAQNRQPALSGSSRTTNQHSQTSANQRQRTPRASASERVSQNGLSYEDEMRDCMKRIPWDQLSTDSHRKIKSVAQQHSLFHRMPTQAVYCDQEIFQYLLKHPDLVVGFWERLGVTEISVKELKEDKYLMRETTGTVANVEVLHRTKNLCIVYAKGQYRAPFLARGIDGETILFLRSRFGRDKDGEPFVVCALDVFIKIDNAGVDFLAKLFATSLGKIADSNFEQTVAFVGHVSDASTVNADSVKTVSRQVRGVRKEVREDFADLVDQVCTKSSRREEGLLPRYYSLEASRNEPPGPNTGSDVLEKAESRNNVSGRYADPSTQTSERIFRGYDAMFPEDFDEKTETAQKPSEAETVGKIGRDAASEIADKSTVKTQTSYAVPSLPVGGRITLSVVPADQTQRGRSVYEMPMPPGSSGNAFAKPTDNIDETARNSTESDVTEPSETSVPSNSAREHSATAKPKGRVVFGTPRVVRPD